VSGYYVRASLTEYATWQVCIEERLELLEEVRAGEQRERALEQDVADLEHELDLVSGGWAARVAGRQALHDEIADLREQLAEWSETRTTGGLRRPYSGANWTANLIEQGALPPELAS
jgi:hypothetical protein